MWKYKKAIINGIGLSFVILIYTLLMKDVLKEAVYIHLLNNWLMTILLSASVFYIIYQRYNNDLMAYRFDKIRKYIQFETFCFIKSLSLFFIIIVMSQIIIFSLLDSRFYILTFLYRYIILFWLFILVGIMMFIGKRKNDFKRVIFFLITWNVSYMIFCMFPNSIVSQVMPYNAFKNINLDKISTLIFLNFSQFKNLRLSKLSIKYIVIFIVFFHIVFYQRLSIVTENTSYLSMLMHKQKKMKTIKDILLKNFIDFGFLYFIIIVWIFVFGITISIMEQIDFEYSVYVHILIYLIKYITFIYAMYTIYQIISIIKNSPYLSLLSYIIFMICLIGDMAFGSHIITLSNSISNEFIWLLYIVILVSIILFITIYQFLNTKEIYND